MDLRPAELLLGDVEAERRLDDRRPAREDLRAGDHHVPVGEVGVQRADAGGRAHHRRDAGHDVEQPTMPAAAPITADTHGTTFSSSISGT